MINFIPPHSNTLPGADDIARFTLNNGVTVLCRSNFNSPSVVVSGYIAVGSLFDAVEKLGTAYFTASALMRGTQRRSFQQIYDAMESVGASLGFSSGVHTTGFSGKALAEDISLIFELLADALRMPVFPIDQVDKLRDQILTGLAIRAQDTREMASLTFDQLLFKNHPYQYPEDGYPETIKAIQQADLVQFHKTNYGPKGMVIVIVGSVEPMEMLEEIQKYFGDWVNPLQVEAPELPSLQALSETVSKRVVIAGKSQADIVMGTSCPNRTSPDYLPISLGNNILGQFGMMGRIGDVVREQSGLAYYAYTSLSAGVGPGSWEVSAGVNPANIQKAIDLIQQELTRFTNEKVKDEELNDSKANYIGRLPLSLESNQGVAGAILALERYQLGLDYYRQYTDLVNSVSSELILEATRKYLSPDKLAIAIASPE
jgi:zinc protease